MCVLEWFKYNWMNFLKNKFKFNYHIKFTKHWIVNLKFQSLIIWEEQPPASPFIKCESDKIIIPIKHDIVITDGATHYTRLDAVEHWRFLQETPFYYHYQIKMNINAITSSLPKLSWQSHFRDIQPRLVCCSAKCKMLELNRTDKTIRPNCDCSSRYRILSSCSSHRHQDWKLSFENVRCSYVYDGHNDGQWWCRQHL